MKFEEIYFDVDDKNLFLVDDLKLKAEAIQHSVLPKLEIITNQTISLLTNVFHSNPLELSTVLKFPNFRKKRIKDFAINYTEAQAGLGPKRSKTLWTRVKKINGEQPMILPFSLTYCLDEFGLYFYFTTTRYGLKLEDYHLFYLFHLHYKEEIDILAMESDSHLFLSLDDYKKFALRPKKIFFDTMIDENRWELSYISSILQYPISNSSICDLINNYITFYIIYENYINLSSGNYFRFESQLNLLRLFLTQTKEINFKQTEKIISKTTTFTSQQLLKNAGKKIKVMPAIRWQVFQRDNWKCVACGRNSETGAVLHIDHIIPRSKGGQDHIDNYQTLCETCNIGKSNRDQTDLRKKHNTRR